MTINEATEHTKNKLGMKLCITGLIQKISNFKGRLPGSYQYSLSEFSKHYKEAKGAWLKGDLETVAEFFGLYTAR